MHELGQKRKLLEQSWRTYLKGGTGHTLRQDIVESWERSLTQVSATNSLAPKKADISDLMREWYGSSLFSMLRPLLTDLEQQGRDTGFIAAIASPTGQILWVGGDTQIRNQADRMNFAEGALWAEEHIGTNGIGLALAENRPTQVFSAEHFAQSVHDWVCYSAPIQDPASMQPLGVVDITTLWNRAHPYAMTIVTMIVKAIQEHLNQLHSPIVANQSFLEKELVVMLMGQPKVYFQGQPLHLKPRQIEILTLLALHPDGLTGNELYNHIYGDTDVSAITLKAEVSHLRSQLKGAISSRPYALKLSSWFDVLEIDRLLKEGNISMAVRLYRGSLLPQSQAPWIVEMRDLLEAQLRNFAIRAQDPTALWQLAQQTPHDLELWETLADRLPESDYRRFVAVSHVHSILRTQDKNGQVVGGNN